MASRHKLAESPFYKAKKATSASRGKSGKSKGSIKKLLQNEQTTVEKKLALRSEAKEIMERIDKLTTEYDGSISQVVIGSPAEAKSSAANGAQNSSTSKGVENKGTIKQHVITSEMQFKTFQQDKGRMTMIMLDHEKVRLWMGRVRRRE